jgi:peptidyl-prolyl cis-trans isomerase B (cyclophilin B)
MLKPISLPLALGLWYGLTLANVAAQTVAVELQTNLGNILLELDRERAPLTVDNFAAYVRRGFYDGTIFHRVIRDFMIQGGGYDRLDGEKVKPTMAAIRNESANGLMNVKYTIAMARADQPDSATSQFFINTAVHNIHLDRGNAPDGFGYCVFGKVIRGYEVVDNINAVAVRPLSGTVASQPVEPIIIVKALIVGDVR